MGALALALAAAPVGVLAGPALPTNGQVVAGQATITLPSGASLVVDQQSQRAIIDWQSFSVGAGGTVQFNNGSGATLNRVTGGDPSAIAGMLRATGSLYLINPAGVVVDGSGQVLTGGSFVASTRGIGNDAFMAGGDLSFVGSGAGRVENRGQIVAGGDAVLIGATTLNSGSITAGGTAGLAAGATVTLREAGSDARISVAGASGDVTNSGGVEAVSAELRAAGGNVYALAGTSGLIRATGTETRGGRIWLTAGKDIAVEQGATLDASASTATGGGGEVHVITTEGRLDFKGTALAKGGAQGGDGGFIETSGHRGIDVGGSIIDASAPAGRAGEWLIDPYDLFISSADATSVSAALQTGTNVELLTTASNTGNPAFGFPQEGAGNITIRGAISWTSTARLTLNAYNNIIIDRAITAPNGALSLLIGQNNPNAASSQATQSAAISVRSLALAGNGTFTLTGANAISRLEASTIRNLDLRSTQGDLSIVGDVLTTATSADPVASIRIVNEGDRLIASNVTIGADQASTGRVSISLGGGAPGGYGYGPVRLTGVTLRANAAPVTVAGTGRDGADPTRWDGVVLTDTTISSIFADISISGRSAARPIIPDFCGDNCPTLLTAYGVRLANVGATSSIASSGGNITIDGRGIVGVSLNDGSSQQAVINASTGALTVTGAGFGTVAPENGVTPALGYTFSGGVIAGNVRLFTNSGANTITGTGDTANRGSFGVWLAKDDFATQVGSTTGVVTINGTGAAGLTANSGTQGLRIGGNATISTTGGAINLAGSVGSLWASTPEIRFDGTAATTVDAGGGQIKLTADNVDLLGNTTGATLQSAGGRVLFQTRDSSRNVTLGGTAANSLSLTAAQLARVTTVNLGVATGTGDITIAGTVQSDLTGNALRRNLTLTTAGGNIGQTGSFATSDLTATTGGGNVALGTQNNAFVTASIDTSRAGGQGGTINLRTDQGGTLNRLRTAANDAPVGNRNTVTLSMLGADNGATMQQTGAPDGIVASELIFNSSAPQLSNESNSFILGSSLNRIATVSGGSSRTVALVTSNGAMTLGNLTARMLTIDVAGDLAIGPNSTLTLADSGPFVQAHLRASGTFKTSGNATIAATNGGLFRIYVADPSKLDIGTSLTAKTYYGTNGDSVFGTGTSNPVAVSGSRFVFASTPTATVTPDDRTVDYDGTAKGATGYSFVRGGALDTVGGFSRFDDLSEIVGSATSQTQTNVRRAGDAASAVLAHDIQYSSLTSGIGANLVTGTGRLTINPKAVQVTGVTVGNKIYDGSPSATTLLGGTVVVDTGITGEALTVVTSGATATFASANVAGTLGSAEQAQAVTVTGYALADGTGGLASNYTIVQPTGLTAVITRRDLTVTIQNKTKTYGDVDPALTFSVAGLATDDTVTSALTGGFTGGDVGSGVQVTSNGALLRGGDNNVGGVKAITNSGADPLAATNNYRLATVTDGALTIDPRPLTLAFSGTIAKTYDGNTSVNLTGSNLTLSGWADGEGVGAAVTPTGLNPITASFATKDAGTGILVTLAPPSQGATTIAGSQVDWGGANPSNYALPTTTLSANVGTINKAQLTVGGLIGQDRIYNGLDTASVTFAPGGVTLSGVVSGETITVDPSNLAGRFDDANVRSDADGTVLARNVAVTGVNLQAGAGTSLSNYELAPLTLTAKILRAPLTITIDSKSQTYGDIVRPLTFSVSGLVNNETVSTALTGGGFTGGDVGNGATVTSAGGLTRVAGTDAGTYQIAAATGANALAATGNYSIQTVSNANYVINRRNLTVSLTGSVTKIYDGSDTVTNLTDANYLLAGFAQGEGAGSAVTKTTGEYDGKNVDTGKVVRVTLASQDFSLAGGANIANYNLPTGLVSGTVGTITKKDLIVSGLTATSRAYDGTLAAVVSGGAFSLGSGLVSGDNVTLSTTTTGLFASRDVGTGLTVTATGFSISGVDAGNYNLIAPTALAQRAEPDRDAGGGHPGGQLQHGGDRTRRRGGRQLPARSDGQHQRPADDQPRQSRRRARSRPAAATGRVGGAHGRGGKSDRALRFQWARGGRHQRGDRGAADADRASGRPVARGHLHGRRQPDQPRQLQPDRHACDSGRDPAADECAAAGSDPDAAGNRRE